MESFSSTKIQIHPLYIIEGYKLSVHKKTLFDVVYPSSIYFKITPKYLIILIYKVITDNTTNKFPAEK